jgi:hypothetical protein
MPKLPCWCGYVHNLSAIPDDGFQVLPDWATDKLLYASVPALDDREIDDLRRTALSRLYLCPNCEAIMWDRAGDDHFTTYLRRERLIRIFADLGDRDPLGGIWLRHPRTLVDLEREHLLLHAGGYLVVHNDYDGVYACLGSAFDETEAVVPDAWVARPLDEDTTARLRAQGG